MSLSVSFYLSILFSISPSPCHWPHCHGLLFLFVLSISPLISSISARCVFIHVCSDVPIWDLGRTFLWQCHSHLPLWPDLQSLQARIQSGIFWMCDDISAERFKKEEISLTLINLMGRLSPHKRQNLYPRSSAWLFKSCLQHSRCLQRINPTDFDDPPFQKKKYSIYFGVFYAWTVTV